MRGYNCYEKIEVYRTTNRVCLEAGGNRHSSRGSLPQDGHFRSHVFQLETQIFRSRNAGAAAVAAARRRELAAQTSRRRFDARQANAAGRVEKKALRAKQRRQLVKKLIDEYRISVRRACTVCLLARSLLYYKLRGPRDDRAVRARIKEIAAFRPLPFQSGAS
jgi:hypothetical protein